MPITWPGGMRGAPGTLSVFWPNNIILPKPGMGGSLQYLQGFPGTLLCSGGVSSMFYRGPRGPLDQAYCFLQAFRCWSGGSVEGSPNFCRCPCLMRQDSLPFSHCLRRHKEEACRGLFFWRDPPLLGGGKRAWFLQFLQAPLPHASGFPTFFTLPQASGGGSV